jgi:carbon monoxide dehydrogenase subunit G
MNHIHMESRIEAPVEHVWAFLCDASHWDDWDAQSKHSDFSGPLDRVGTTFVETSRMMGFEMKGTLSVMEVEPTRFLHIRSDFGQTEMFFRMEPEGDATRLSVDAAWEMPGHIPGFIKNLMTKSWVERHMRQQMEDFKALAEATVPVPA